LLAATHNPAFWRFMHPYTLAERRVFLGLPAKLLKPIIIPNDDELRHPTPSPTIPATPTPRKSRAANIHAAVKRIFISKNNLNDNTSPPRSPLRTPLKRLSLLPTKNTLRRSRAASFPSSGTVASSSTSTCGTPTPGGPRRRATLPAPLSPVRLSKLVRTFSAQKRKSRTILPSPTAISVVSGDVPLPNSETKPQPSSAVVHKPLAQKRQNNLAILNAAAAAAAERARLAAQSRKLGKQFAIVLRARDIFVRS